MLLAHLSIALLVECFGAWGEEGSAQRRPYSWISRSWQALFAVVVAVALIFTYHSFLHNRNTTLGVMLLGLNWAAVFGQTGRSWHQDRERSVDVSLSITTFLVCIVLLFWKENLLVAKGIKVCAIQGAL
jgi:hypothetical protein